MLFNSVVKESCFKPPQDIIAMYVHDVTTLLTTNLIPSAYFHFNVKSKKRYGQGYLTTGKKSFTVFCCSKFKVKRSKCQLFYLPARWPDSFLPTVNVANQKIL